MFLTSMQEADSRTERSSFRSLFLYIGIYIIIRLNGGMMILEQEELIGEEISPSPVRKGNNMLLIIIQLIVCTVITLGALAVKLIGGELHAAVGTWFYENYNNTVFIEDIGQILPMNDPVSVKETSIPVPENDEKTE